MLGPKCSLRKLVPTHFFHFFILKQLFLTKSLLFSLFSFLQSLCWYLSILRWSDAGFRDNWLGFQFPEHFFSSLKCNSFIDLLQYCLICIVFRTWTLKVLVSEFLIRHLWHTLQAFPKSVSNKLLIVSKTTLMDFKCYLNYLFLSLFSLRALFLIQGAETKTDRIETSLLVESLHQTDQQFLWYQNYN